MGPWIYFPLHCVTDSTSVQKSAVYPINVPRQFPGLWGQNGRLVNCLRFPTCSPLWYGILKLRMTHPDTRTEYVWRWKRGLHSDTDRSRDKKAAVSQTTLSNAYSWTKIYVLILRFHWSLFLGFKLTIFLHLFRKWLGTQQATCHYLSQWWLD